MSKTIKLKKESKKYVKTKKKDYENMIELRTNLLKDTWGYLG
jgi:hypothetical protein